MKPNLVLVGFMGTGKSTVGQIIAQRLGLPFIDTDTLIEAESGLRVRDIFLIHGEAHFRALESEACRKLSAQGGRVIAPGGGAILHKPNREALERSGVMVLLTCESAALFDRLEESAQRGERPLLEGDFRQRAGELLAARSHVYDSVALKIDTTRLTPDEVAEQVLALYEAHEGARMEAAAQ
ncbi:MAG: shikimate kinase [Chloroflexota bacterium]